MHTCVPQAQAFVQSGGVDLPPSVPVLTTEGTTPSVETTATLAASDGQGEHENETASTTITDTPPATASESIDVGTGGDAMGVDASDGAQAVVTAAVSDVASVGDHNVVSTATPDTSTSVSGMDDTVTVVEDVIEDMVDGDVIEDTAVVSEQ